MSRNTAICASVCCVTSFAVTGCCGAQDSEVSMVRAAEFSGDLTLSGWWNEDMQALSWSVDDDRGASRPTGDLILSVEPEMGAGLRVSLAGLPEEAMGAPLERFEARACRCLEAAPFDNVDSCRDSELSATCTWLIGTVSIARTPFECCNSERCWSCGQDIELSLEITQTSSTGLEASGTMSLHVDAEPVDVEGHCGALFD